MFSEADVVLFTPNGFKTLDTANIRSGYAEMLKHGLIADEAMWAELINFNLAQLDLQFN